MTDTLTKLNCAKRELEMRRQVYPRRVSEGKMSSSQMHHEIETMQAIVDDYQAQVEAEQPRLV